MNRLSKTGLTMLGFAVMASIGCPGLTGSDRSTQVYAAWYVDGPSGPVVVIEETTFIDGFNGDSINSRHAARTEIGWISQRVEDGAETGKFAGANHRLAGASNGAIWMCNEQDSPLLLKADTFETMADRAKINEAVGNEMGGDFETRCYVDQYTGNLALDGADGKGYWLTTGLEHEMRANDAVTPKGWFCNVGNSDLIEPTVVRCLSPETAPAAMLALTKSSALAKDEGKTQVLNGLAAAWGEPTTALWSTPLTELAETTEVPLWLGVTALSPDRVVVLLRTEKTRVHVITIDPKDGAVVERKMLGRTTEKPVG